MTKPGKVAYEGTDCERVLTADEGIDSIDVELVYVCWGVDRNCCEEDNSIPEMAPPPFLLAVYGFY